jgi:hypothetical protein
VLSQILFLPTSCSFPICFPCCPQLLENVTRHQLTEHLADILPPIQGALCDPDPTVREAAGSAFGVLFKGGAHGAVESVVPSLLHGLDSPAHASQSMEGLRVILGVRPQVGNTVMCAWLPGFGCNALHCADFVCTTCWGESHGVGAAAGAIVVICCACSMLAGMECRRILDALLYLHAGSLHMHQLWASLGT